MDIKIILKITRNYSQWGERDNGKKKKDEESLQKA